ncbi:MAG: cobyrinate a,c-diamide synthase [Planctomycetota bacterium]|jgi:cobyrinic acid a,c-diamide synthase
MSASCGRLVIAGTSSGVGKTSVTLGLARALCRRSLQVQPFKVGPDFLDPTYLTRATGQTCYNLDGWMTDRRYVGRLFRRVTEDADVALVEGVMGMFDGADPASLAGSTAEIAEWLDASVLLVVDAHGLAQTLAAVVKGFVDFEPSVRIAGIVANRTGSARHEQWLSEALRSANLPPLVGAIPRGAFDPLESRHLGLVTADRERLPSEQIEQLADACEEHIDIDAVVSLARVNGRSFVAVDSAIGRSRRIRVGVARDKAFHFCYPDNLEALEQHGAEVVFFSPVLDESLPVGLSGVYLPGGYPELYAEALSTNRPMLAEIGRFADSGKCLYAECGGLMYLGREIETVGGIRLPMASVLPIVTRMLDRKKALGYVEVTLQCDTLWGTADTNIRGHEFHYSEIVEDHATASEWQQVYSIRRRRSDKTELAGFQKDNVLAGYPHLHWAANPDAVEHFIQRCEDAV